MAVDSPNLLGLRGRAWGNVEFLTLGVQTPSEEVFGFWGGIWKTRVRDIWGIPIDYRSVLFTQFHVLLEKRCKNMYLIYPDSVFVVLDLCKIFMTCSFSLVPGKPWLPSKQQTIFFTHCQVPRFLFHADCLFWKHKLKRSAMRKKHRLNGLYWMVDLQQVFIETKSNLQHKSSTTGFFYCMVDHVRKENRHLHQEKITQKDPPQKKSPQTLPPTKQRTDKKTGKKAPTQKIRGGSSPVQENRGHDTTNPNNTLWKENPAKWPCMCILCVKLWFPPNMANSILENPRERLARYWLMIKDQNN